MQKTQLLSKMPKGIDAVEPSPTGEKIIAWGTGRGKYKCEIRGKTENGPYAVWLRNVERTHFRGGPGRPRWRKVASGLDTLTKAREEARAAMETCTFAGKPRIFLLEFLR